MTEALTDKLTIAAQNDEEIKEETQNIEESEIEIDDEDLIEDIDIEAEHKKLSEDVKSINDGLRDELAKLNTEFETSNLINTLKGLIEEHKGNAKFKDEIKEIKNLIHELESCNNFEPLIKSVGRIKNPKKIFDRYESDLDNALKKLIGKFNDNARYMFIDPIKNDIVGKVISLLDNEQDGKLFVYVFAGYASNQKTINANSVFINEVLRQIKYSNKLSDDKKEELKSNIQRVLDVIK